MSTAEQNTNVVPKGHRVVVFTGRPFPFVQRTSGGALVACTGLGGDDQAAEIKQLFDRIETELSPANVRIVNEAGTVSDLFAPNEPATEVVENALALLFQENALTATDEKPGFVSEIIHRLRSLALRTRLVIYVAGPVGHELRRVLSELRFPVRRPADDGGILLEVHRPDGKTLTGFVGAEADILSEPFVPNPELKLPARAPRLARYLLSVATSNDGAATQALHEYLATRAWHMALIATPNKSGEMVIAPMQWSAHHGFSVYPDRATFGRAVRELNLADGTFAMARMPPAVLFDFAVSNATPIALCVYATTRDGTSSPLYVPIQLDELRALAARVPR